MIIPAHREMPNTGSFAMFEILSTIVLGEMAVGAGWICALVILMALGVLKPMRARAAERNREDLIGSPVHGGISNPGF